MAGILPIKQKRMYPLYISSQGLSLSIVGGITIGVIAMTALGIYELQSARHAFASGVAQIAHPADVVYLSAKAAAAASASEKAPMQEVHIANNGLTLLRGARVVSISGSVIRVSMIWGSSSFIWQVRTDSNTKFEMSTGESSTFANVQVGDAVTVTGMLSNSGAEPSISAQYVRD